MVSKVNTALLFNRTIFVESENADFTIKLTQKSNTNVKESIWTKA